jgi:hypothetical protein
MIPVLEYIGEHDNIKHHKNNESIEIGTKIQALFVGSWNPLERLYITIYTKCCTARW